MKNESSISGHRFGVLRRIFSLTQKGLAQRLDVGQSFLSQIERGNRPAPESLAQAASAEFGLPRTFFTVAATPLESGPGTFRKTSQARVRDDARLGELYNEASRLFRIVSEESGYRVGELPHPEAFGEDPEQAAALMRRRAGLDTREPVLNVTRTLERLGFGVIHQLDDEREESQHSGLTRPSPLTERPLVALVGNAPGAVKRLTLLHEAYHHIADRNLRAPITSTRSPEEVRAFRFAAAFLLPESVARERITPDLPLHGYLPIKADYGISISAAIRRAKDLGLIGEARMRSLYIQWSSAGWRTEEPVSVPDERPMLLAQATARVFGEYPVQRAAEEVGTRPSWIQRWGDFVAHSDRPVSSPKVVELNSERLRRRPTAAAPSSSQKRARPARRNV